MSQPNYRMIAIEAGDLLKYDTSLNEIDRVANGLFRFRREDFPSEGITSSRAQRMYDWILSLAKQEMNPQERNRLLHGFCSRLAGSVRRAEIESILKENGATHASADREADVEFTSRAFHAEVHKHSRALYLQGNYFHAVFESAKAYNKAVREKAHTDKDGQALMLDVWGWQKGVLKVTRCETETDKNVQEGVKFLSAGLMQAIRNPTAHEPAVDWPIAKQDCLDILGFLSFLFRRLDEAVYYSA